MPFGVCWDFVWLYDRADYALKRCKPNNDDDDDDDRLVCLLIVVLGVTLCHNGIRGQLFKLG